MDRRLLIIATFCLVLELVLFMGGMGLLPYSPFSAKRGTIEQEKLGEIQTARRNVRRRGFDSNIWEDSAPKDFVYENDSLLTLSDSSAKLKLRGDLNLELQENTLVVLEASESDGDKQFRLRFSRGDMRSQSGLGRLQVHSGEWVISATQGSDISMRAVDSQRVEVEVHSGDVHVAHALHGQVRELSKDQRVTLFPEEAGEVVTPSRILTWSDSRPQKIYAHEFPVNAKFKWLGSAETLEVLAPGKGTESHKIKKTNKEIELRLHPGSHHLTLKSSTEISRTIALQVMRAPKIIHLTPLPRNRVKTNHAVLFAWLSEIKAASYRLELASDLAFKNIVHTATTKDARVETEIPVTGSLHWHVIAIDEDGFVIPAAYAYPLITHPDPLAPPKLRSPTSQESPDDARHEFLKGHWLVTVWRLFFPLAHGETQKHMPPVIFNWDTVPGAEFYIIEISTSADFSNPEVIAKTSTNIYAWGRFSKKVYYYRVAGGTKDGRVGYFSEPERVDLTNWPPPRVKRATTSAEIISIVTPLPEVTKTEPTVVEATPLPPIATAKIELKPRSRKIDGKIWWLSNYTSIEESGPETTKSSRAGATPIGIGLELSGERNHGWWRSQIEAAQYTWQPKSETTWPYQPDQETLIWHASLHLSSELTGWGYGVVVDQSPIMNRQGLEEVSLDENTSFGISINGDFKRGKQTHAHSLALTHSSELIRIAAKNNWRWYLSSLYFIGAQGDLSYGFGDDRTLTEFDLGLQIGRGW